MKILFLTFPIAKIGGIKTALEYLREGFKELNIYTEHYSISLNKSKLPNKNNVLGFEKKEWLNEYFNVVNKFDLVIWFTTCPHKLKNYQKETWKVLFNIKPKQMAYIHDPYYERYYSWYKEIPSKYKIKLICPWKHMFDSIKSLPAMKKIIPNAFISDSIGLYNDSKENIVVDANNWKMAKRKVDLIKIADKINGEILSFGNESELPFYLAKKEKNFNLIKHLGWQNREKVLKEMEKAKIVVDLLITGTGSVFDYTILEGISRGAIPITYYSSGCNFFKTIVSPKNRLVETINKVLKNFDVYSSLREQNLSYLRFLLPKKIAKEILNYSQENYKVTENLGALF